MHTHQEDAIRDRAYALWVEAGSPEGNDWQFWHEAEQQLGGNGHADNSNAAAVEAVEGEAFAAEQLQSDDDTYAH